MTTRELIENRKAFVRNGRSAEGNRLQREYRIKYNLGPNEAALHNPDQIAGGGPVPTGRGSINVNSSIGSQWRSAVPELDQHLKSIPRRFWDSALRGSEYRIKLIVGP